MPDFSDVRDSYLNIDRGWPELAVAIQNILEPEAMTVLPYASRGTNLNLLQTLVPGLDMAGMVEPDHIANKSATDAALETLQDRYRAGVDLSRADWRTVIERHAANTAPRGFAAFSEAERADLSSRYASDLKQIEWMPKINVA